MIAKLTCEKTEKLLKVITPTTHFLLWERNGSVVECLTQDRGVADSSLTGVNTLSLSKVY